MDLEPQGSKPGIGAFIFGKVLRTTQSRIGAAIVIAILAFVLVVPLAVPYSPYAITGIPNSPPSLSHLFGTDNEGHDVLAQVAYGAYPSLLTGLAAAIGSTILGLVIGVFGGYYRRLDGVLSGMTDVIMAIPAFVLLIIVGSIFYPTDALIIGAVTLVQWGICARAVRAQVASVKNPAYIDAEKLSGRSDVSVVLRVILPEVLPIALAYFVVIVSYSIILIASLQFIGIGNITVVSWGSILFYAQQYAFFNGDWWWVLAPGVLIALVSVGTALIGFSFEEVSNPRLRV